MTDERRRILELLAEERISVDQAEALLRALGGAGRKNDSAVPAAPLPPAAPPPRGARSLQIVMTDGRNGKNINVTVPLALGKFAGKFLPPDARDKMLERGIDLQEILQTLDDPAGIASGTTLVTVQADNSRDGATGTIVIKAV